MSAVIFRLLLASTLLPGTLALAKPAPPNIVHIIADDLGWNDVGFHGSDIPTPQLDRLAATSVELHRFYVAPICSPTRAGTLTGRYPFRFGIWDGVCNPTSRHGLPPAETTLPEMLASTGYPQRALLGKWHLGLASSMFHPLEHGFTTFYGHYNGAIDYFSRSRAGELDWHRGREAFIEDGYSTDLLGSEAVRIIRENETPFYLLVSFNAPHSPLQAADADLAAVGFDPAAPIAPHTEADIARREKAPRYGLAGKGNTKRQTFAAMTRALDRNIGLILDAIDASPRAADTLVIFHSDNGADPHRGGSNSPLRGNKFSTWEGGTRVVALLRWPARLKGGRKFEPPTCYLDLLPTLAAASTTEPPSDLDGLNLLPALEGTAELPQRDILLGKDAVVSGRWKLHGNQLFNLETDPREQHDLAAGHPEILARLKSSAASFSTLRGPAFRSRLPLPDAWPPADWSLPAEPAGR